MPDATFQFFDFTYDGTGPWEKDRPGQHSSLEFAQDNVQYWLRCGLPKDKAVLGTIRNTLRAQD